MRTIIKISVFPPRRYSNGLVLIHNDRIKTKRKMGVKLEPPEVIKYSVDKDVTNTEGKRTNGWAILIATRPKANPRIIGLCV